MSRYSNLLVMTLQEIPYQITQLNYTRHALAERCKDPRGFIDIAPKAFYRANAKKLETSKTADNAFVAYYIFNDCLDLALVITRTGTVITNYLTKGDNKGATKG